MEVINAIGRRKAAIARVFVTPGTGKIVINNREFTNYVPSTILQYGGGFKGQAEALRLAIARALVKMNPEDKSALKSAGFMTRDAREVERKKPGQPKARKRFQFSKR